LIGQKRKRTCHGIPHNRTCIFEGGSVLSIGKDFLPDKVWGLLNFRPKYANQLAIRSNSERGGSRLKMAVELFVGPVIILCGGESRAQMKGLKAFPPFPLRIRRQKKLPSGV
jgi:hypothetical protein